MKDLIAVDVLDNEIARVTKEDAHKNAILHRAFSVFLFNGNKILIQQRAFNKYHSGGLWANTCCSHPRTNNILSDARQRLLEEVGIECDNLFELYSFVYYTKFDNGLCEYEFDHVILGEYSGEFEINKDEVNDMKWVDIFELAKDIKDQPHKYASWFLICAPKVIEYLIKNKK